MRDCDRLFVRKPRGVLRVLDDIIKRFEQVVQVADCIAVGFLRIEPVHDATQVVYAVEQVLLAGVEYRRGGFVRSDGESGLSHNCISLC